MRVALSCANAAVAQIVVAPSCPELLAERDAERALADRLAAALRHSEERFYAEQFEGGVVTDDVRRYVDTHESLAAHKAARP